MKRIIFVALTLAVSVSLSCFMSVEAGYGHGHGHECSIVSVTMEDVIGSWDPDADIGFVETELGECDIMNVVEGVANILHGVPYSGDLVQGETSNVVGSIQWRFGGAQPLNEGSFTVTGHGPHEFDVREGEDTAAAPFQKPHEFIDKLPTSR